MLFVGHLTLGVLVFLLVQPYLQGNQVLLFLTVLLGSLLPDIDEENSKICKWSGPLGKLVAKNVSAPRVHTQSSVFCHIILVDSALCKFTICNRAYHWILCSYYR